MNNYTLKDNNNVSWVRVSKKTAKKHYNNGDALILCAVKMHPFGTCGGVEITRDRLQAVNLGNFVEFEKIVNEYEFYNCYLNETGKYTAFYVKEV